MALLLGVWFEVVDLARKAVRFVRVHPGPFLMALVLVLFLGCLAWAYSAGQGAERRRWQAAAEQQAAELAAKTAAANAAAASQRSADAAAVAANQEARADAYANHPDAPVSDARRAFNCERLRQASGGVVPAGC